MVRKALSLGEGRWGAGDRGQALWPGSWAECSDKGQADQWPDRTAGSSQLCKRRGSTDWSLGPSRLPCGPPQASPQRSALEPLSSSTVGGGAGRAVLSTWWPADSPTFLPGAPGLFQLGPRLLFLPSALFRVACACCMAVTQRSAKSVRVPETVGPKGTLFPFSSQPPGIRLRQEAVPGPAGPLASPVQVSQWVRGLI